MTSRVPWDDGSDRLRTGYDRLKDGISGDFDAVLKTAGIETDAFAIRPLILGHLDELKQESCGPPLQAAFELLEQIFVARCGLGIGVADTGDRLP